MTGNFAAKDGLAEQLLGLQAQGRVKELVQCVKDWQLTHGSLLKFVPGDENDAYTSGVKASAVPVSLAPSPWPRRLFDDAARMQEHFNELYARLASDEAALE